VPITVPPANPWRDRVWQEFGAGNLTRAYRDVLLTLATFRGPGGLICPAHATLAERASCSVSTVRRALAQAFRLDLVSWTERRIRAGWRWLRHLQRLPACGARRARAARNAAGMAAPPH
jgi:hypothetical protein